MSPKRAISGSFSHTETCSWQPQLPEFLTCLESTAGWNSNRLAIRGGHLLIERLEDDMLEMAELPWGHGK